MADEATSIKRVFFRLRTDGSNLSALEIVNKYLSLADLPLNKHLYSPHYIHEQPQGERVYHIILDINPAAASPEIKIQDIPHELYRVHFKRNKNDPQVDVGSFNFQRANSSLELLSGLRISG